MVLTYKDLSDKEKLVYVKRGFVMGIISILLFSLVTGSFVGAFSIITSWNESFDIQKQTNKEASNYSYNPDLRSFVLGSASLLLMVSFMIVVLGISSLATDLSYYVCSKLKLYTKIDLERTQKNLDKIKDSLKD